jgi:nifR3 family TIM-barrel protein
MKIGEIEFDRPVLLAPMAGVSDMPFRAICVRFGCDLTYTEMISAKAIKYGNKKTLKLFEIDEAEIPCGVQLFGDDPSIMAETAQWIEAEYRGKVGLIDINMGCPMPKITGNNEGSALMRHPELAGNIVRSVSDAVKLPVTVKFRKGWDAQHVNAVEFAKMLEQNGAAALTVHGRTREQFYGGKADWDIITTVKKAVSVPVIGNGDIFSADDALNMFESTHCDGVMVARGAQGNPWLFAQIKRKLQGLAPLELPRAQERIDLALEHARAIVASKGEHAIAQMRKHAAWYIKGMPGAAEIRQQVNACESLAAFERLLTNYKLHLLRVP